MATPTQPTDAELDDYIRFTLAMLGIDLSVLPPDDPDAAVDQADVLSACRSRIRQNLEVLELDPQYHLAAYYASPQNAWIA
jgi:alpha-beta hydrolase superfamily lysophospholipase